MKKFAFLASLFLGIINLANAQDHTYWKWAKGPLTATDYGIGIGISVDAAGYTYVAGNFEGDTIIFQGHILTVPGTPTDDYKIYVLKYDSLGNVLWATCAHGTVTALCIDSFGHIFITGYANGPSITFGNYTFNNTYNGNAMPFLVKYDSLGNVLWAQSTGDDICDAFSNSVTTDALGNAYITGYFDSTRVVFGNDTLWNDSTRTYNAMIVKYDPAGNLLWAKGFGQKYSDQGREITADADNNIYVAGWFDGHTLTLDNGVVLTNKGSMFNGVVADNMFLAKYNQSGALLWAKSFGGAGGAQVWDLKTDANKNIYMTGNYDGPFIAFDSVVLTVDTNPVNSDFFVVKFDSACHTIWARCGDGNVNSTTGGLAIDSDGNVFTLVQFFEPSIAFDADTVYNTGDQNFAVVKYNNTGHAVWAKSPTGGTLDDYVFGLAIDRQDHVYITGSLWSSIVAFGADTIFTTPGLLSAVTARLDDSCARLYPPVNTTTVLSIDSGFVDTLTVSGAGAITWYSVVTGGTYLGAGSRFNTPNLSDTTTYYVQDSTPCGISARTAIKVSVRKTTTGITTINALGTIMVYPNPTSGVIFLKGIASGWKVEVYDVLGEVIHSSIATNDNYVVNLSLQAKGVYFYRVTNNAGAIGQGKIILE